MAPDGTEPAAGEGRTRGGRKSVDQRAKRTRAVVVVPIRTDLREARDGGEGAEGPRPKRSSEARREEAVGLAAAIDLDVIASPVVRVSAP